jgi:hypothetical protein
MARVEELEFDGKKKKTKTREKRESDSVLKCFYALISTMHAFVTSTCSFECKNTAIFHKKEV